jgi:hypothetical protein
MILNSSNKNKKGQKHVKATASRLCTEELSATGAVIDIMDIGKLARVAEDALAAGRTEGGTREAIREWIAINQKEAG